MAKKTLTLESLLAEKNITNPKKWTYESDALNSIIEIARVKPSKITLIAQEMESGGVDEYTACCMLIYESVALFKSKELLKKFEVVEPFEVVDKIFDSNIGEIYELGGQILENYGLMKGSKQAIKKP